jgi:hypothetical protein
MSFKPLLCIAVIFAIAGCQFTDDQRLIGAWSADRENTTIPQFPFAEWSDHMRNAIESSQLKLSADHTFILSGISEVGGTWDYKSNVLTLHAHASSAHKSPLFDGDVDLKVDKAFGVMELDCPTQFGVIKLVLNKTA